MIYLYNGDNLDRAKTPTLDQRIGELPKLRSCEVERDAEGLFDLTLSCDLEAHCGDMLTMGTWIQAPVGGTLGPQYFCIDQVNISERKVVKVHAAHISYSSKSVVAAPFTAYKDNNPVNSTVDFFCWNQNLHSALRTVDQEQLGDFLIAGGGSTMLVNAANYTAPVSLRQAIQDAAKDRGILFLADNFKLILAESDPKATDPSFTIRYGRNLLKYSRSEKREDFYTHIYPYFYNGEEETYTTHPDIIFPLNGLPAKYAGLRKILPVDLTGKYGLKKGTAEDLLAFKTVINIWLEDHPFSEFPSEISLESIPDQGNTYELGLCGRVLSPEGVERHVTIVSMQYDVLRENVVNIGFDRVKKTTSDFIAAIDSIAAILRRAKG